MTEQDEDAATNAAKRMLSMYKHSKYTPEERVTDHAFAYDSHTMERKFWIAVLQAIYQLKSGESK